MGNAHKIVTGTHQRKRPFRRPGLRRKNIIKMDTNTAFLSWILVIGILQPTSWSARNAILFFLYNSYVGKKTLKCRYFVTHVTFRGLLWKRNVTAVGHCYEDVRLSTQFHDRTAVSVDKAATLLVADWAFQLQSITVMAHINRVWGKPQTYDLRFSRRWLWRWRSSGMLRRVVS
jgi:hypothetical protein